MAANRDAYVDCPSCHKGTYPTWEAAERGAHQQRLRKGVRLRPYACPDGHGVHLTTMRSRQRRRYKRPAPNRLATA